jgi:hypothetical protein
MATAPGRDDDDCDDDLLLDPAPPLMHGDMPIRGYSRGEPIPDLARLPRERWRAALRPLGGLTRQLSAASVATPADARAAMVLVGELLLEGRPPGALPAAPRMPSGAAAPARGSSRQVNFRLGPEEHARLVEAARAYGMRPGTFARVLTVRGVDAALYEERRAR